MIVQALFVSPPYPLERRCLRSKQRGLLETYSHDFMERLHITLWNLQKQTSEQTNKPKQLPSRSSLLVCQQNLRALMFLYPGLLLNIEVLVSEFITATLMLIFFSLSLKVFFFLRSEKNHTFQWVVFNLLWTSWPAVPGSWASMEASSPGASHTGWLYQHSSLDFTKISLAFSYTM